MMTMRIAIISVGLMISLLGLILPQTPKHHQ